MWVTAQDKPPAKVLPAGRTLSTSVTVFLLALSISLLVAVCKNSAGSFPARTTSVCGARTCPFLWLHHSPTVCFVPAAASVASPQEFGVGGLEGAAFHSRHCGRLWLVCSPEPRLIFVTLHVVSFSGFALVPPCSPDLFVGAFVDSVRETFVENGEIRVDWHSGLCVERSETCWIRYIKL